MTKEQIRDLRERLGLSTMAFAIRLGVSVDTVRAWEQGSRTPGERNTALLKALSASHGHTEKETVPA